MLPFNRFGSWNMERAIGYTDGVGPDTITAPVSTNAEGDWMRLTGQITRNVRGFFVVPTTGSGDGTNRTYQCDLAIGDSVAPTKTIVENMVVSVGATLVRAGSYHFPMKIAAPHYLWARYQSSATGGALRIVVHPYSGGIDNGESLSRVLTLGAVPASSRGSTITPNASAGTPGTWVDMMMSSGNYPLPHDIRYVNLALGNAGDYTQNNATYLYEIGTRISGAATSAIRVRMAYMVQNLPDHDSVTPHVTHGPLCLPKNHIVSVRATLQAAATTDPLDATVYGVG